MSDDERKNVFSVLDVSNQGKNTYTKLTGLTFQQGETYFVWVIGKCIYTIHLKTFDWKTSMTFKCCY